LERAGGLLATDGIDAAVPGGGAGAAARGRRVGELLPAIRLRQIALERPEVRRQREAPSRDRAHSAVELDRSEVVAWRRDRREPAPLARRHVVDIRPRAQTR